jgi:signal transduction histidine kinase/DNA-binding LacI/PurR family transcriptional regulator/DNA-binding response OmpR family regulator
MLVSTGCEAATFQLVCVNAIIRGHREKEYMAPEYRHGRPTIGVLAGWQFYRTATNLSYLAPIFRGISRAAQNLGCNVLLGCGIGPSASPADPLQPAWPVPSPDHDFVPIGPWNTDGLIIAVPLHSQSRSAYVQELIASGHPILFVGSGEDGPTIVANNTDGILEAMKHLVEHGHREIAFIAGTRDDLHGDTGERLSAYQAGCEISGLNKDPRLIAYGRHVFDGGITAMQQIIDSGVKFTAMLASNDESALGAMQVLERAGRRIPQDVAVIGFDNRPEGAVQKPGLTSINVPLFNVGYRAVDLMLQHIDSRIDLPELVKVDTRLVIRESCGCSVHSPNRVDHHTPLVKNIATTIQNQAHSLTEDEGLALGQRLVDSFTTCIQSGDPIVFQDALEYVLQRTTIGDDDAHIWQDAISLLGKEWDSVSDLPSASLAHRFLDEARTTISAHMRQQHRQYVVDERWTSSRLSLLTARLLTALDEAQIYQILATHLPDMSIHIALLALFEAEGDDPFAWSLIRNTIHPEQQEIRFRSQDFPPVGLFAVDQQFLLTLIPLTGPIGQSGFMVFATEHFDLYGLIVQQLGGAFNTARLYRQATEGRRLAEEANRMKSRFLSTISHELRTPLNLIIGLSGMVLRDSDESESPLPELARKDIDRILAYSQHLSGLIGDVIDLATSDAGQLRLNNEYVDVGQALRIVAESGNQLAADKGLGWEAELPESGPWVWGDQTRLRQVALNLISNAIKFTAKGSISLRVEDMGDSVTVMVQDTGLGISPDEQQAIFDEFRQSERSVSRGYGGLGLGLAISKRLVELHDGTIAVHSTGEEGTGSTFSFSLPTVQPPKEQTRQLESAPSANQLVMVLTNDANTCERLCEHLRQRGFSVQVMLTNKRTDWHSHLRERHPDSIILDVSTDSALGWKTLKEIKTSPNMAGIPVLFFSSSQLNGSLLELDYLTKPIEIWEMTRALDQYWLMTDPTRPMRSILVVDDEPNTLEMHARVVQAHSSANRVWKAHNGKEALEILHREIIDLVLLDLQMPEMDGFEVLEVMRSMESTRRVPVIVVTGTALTETDMTRLNQGVAAVLGKGLFSIEETVAHISTALEHKRKLSGEAQRLVRSAMAFIHENYAEAISRRDIAQRIGLTEDHLTFCFRQELGTTPIAYLQRYRINQAKRLLKESQQTITDIAEHVGFADRGYFSRIFHREAGMSPEAFRRS